MGILFVISIAALLALLWAAFSTARHIRRARRRQRQALEAVEAIKREANAAVPAAKMNSQAGNSTGSAEAKPTSATRDWSQMRYSPSTFTAEHTLHRKV